MKDAEEIGNRLDPSQNTRQGPFSLVPIGCDYSSRVSVMFMGDMSLPSTMSQDVLGVVSLIDGQGRPLGFDFGMRSEQSARDFFGLLHHWADQRGGTNAVVLEFLMLDDGEVILLCGEDTDSIVKMFCPERYQSDLMPLVCAILSQKSFPKPTPMLLRLLSGGTLHEVDIGARVLAPDDKVPPAARVPGLTLHKQEIPVWHENEIAPGSQAGAFLRARAHAADMESEPHGPSPPFTTPASTFAERRGRMQRLFPISLAILLSSVAVTSLKASLLAQGYRTWQIQQAMCNLIAFKRWSSRMIDTEHDKKFCQADLVQFLIDGPEMVSNVDLFDGVLDEGHVKEQIITDSRELLGRYTTPTVRTLEATELQPALDNLGLLGEADDCL